MEYCKYHPITTATHECLTCLTFNCDDCFNDASRNQNGLCFICKSEMIDLGVSNNVTPFWRRLQESFSYPVNFDSILFIIGLAILSTVVKYMHASIFGLAFNLLLTSALLKYCFTCLDNTSHGLLKAPDITEAFGAGFKLALLVIFMFIAIGAAIWATSYFFGNMLSSLVTVVLIAGFPAMIIIFAMTENVVESLNPRNMLDLMLSIGLPYGLLLAFILIMSGSVGIINQLIGSDFSMLTIMLQSMVAYYYMIVVFHIMGYMIYQYQDELGFDRGGVIKNSKPAKTVLQKALSQIDILLKEGELEEVIPLYDEIVKSYPEERHIKSRYFELLLVTKSIEKLNKYAEKYLNHLTLINREDKIPLSYKRVLKVNPKYNPESAELRYKLAKICHSRGDAKPVIRLINGLHTKYPDFDHLVPAYEMMADSLESLPNMQLQAQKCRQLIKTFKT